MEKDLHLNGPQGLPLTGEKADLPLVITHAIFYASQTLAIGLIIYDFKVPLDIAGDFWASIAGIIFLSNICGIGSDRFISIQVQRLKKYYLSSLKNNLVSLFSFFSAFFATVSFIALVMDLLAYALIRMYPEIISSQIAHPAELCLFCIFFFLIANFMAAFLQSEGYQAAVMRVGIISIIVRLVAVFAVLAYDVRLGPIVDNDYNLVFTLCLVISASEIIRIIGFTYYIYRYLKKIALYDGQVLDLQWRKDIWHYALYSLQYDWVVIGTIIVEMFGRDDLDPAIFGYLFGVVRLFHILGRIIQQLTRDSLVRSLFNLETFISSFRRVIISGTLITSGFLVVVLLLVKDITRYYHIMQYITPLRYLVIISAVKALAESFLLMTIFAYSKKVMRIYVYSSTLIYFWYIYSMVSVAPLGVNFAILAYTKFYLAATLFEVIVGLSVLTVLLKRNQLRLIWLYNKPNTEV